MSQRSSAMTEPIPTLIFDGECRFCRHWIDRWRRWTEDRVNYIAFQQLGQSLPQVSREDCENAVQFVDVDGTVFSGADAIIRLFDFGLPGGSVARWICAHPPVIWFLRAGYWFVARNRQFFSRLTRISRDGKMQ